MARCLKGAKRLNDDNPPKRQKKSRNEFGGNRKKQDGLSEQNKLTIKKKPRFILSNRSKNKEFSL